MSLSNFLYLRKSIILCIFGMLFIFSGEVLANKGLEIALKSDENFDGYGDSSSEMIISEELSPYPSKFSSLFKAISKPLFAKTSPENIKSMPNMHRIIDFLRYKKFERLMSKLLRVNF